MSFCPRPVARVLLKKSRWPSTERDGPASPLVVFTPGPRLMGVSHTQSSHARCETHRSVRPMAPVRFELKYRLRPWSVRNGLCSRNDELIGAPTLIGSDHSP